MLYYERIHVSEGIDLNKRSESKECHVCHYWYLLNKGFKNLSDIAILNVKGSYYCCIISGISKNDAINLMSNVDFTEKSRILYKNNYHHI